MPAPDEFFAEHAGRVTTTALVTWRRHRAAFRSDYDEDDAVQEALLLLHRLSLDTAAIRHPKTFVERCARNHVIDCGRTRLRGNHPQMVSPRSVPDRPGHPLEEWFRDELSDAPPEIREYLEARLFRTGPPAGDAKIRRAAQLWLRAHDWREDG